MIARYSRPEMVKLWNDRSRYLLWLDVEMAVCRELHQDGLIPDADWALLQKQVNRLVSSGGVDPDRVNELEKTTRHDVIAFTTAVAEKVGEVSRYIHFGLTSSDVVDTALSIALQRAGQEILADVDSLLKTLKTRALEFKDLPAMGRTHGIYAEPTSFGLKFLGWYTEWKRNRSRLQRALERLRVGKLSGAVGVNAHWSPGFERRVLRSLGLRREPVSTQVLPRDRHAEFLCTLAILGSSMERIAVELRHLQRTEVSEVMEGFQQGQKGSSAMPHKRNPISSENLTGIARLLRSYSQAALEDVALWHERDISHSSVERVIFPDATIVLDYGLRRLDQVLRELVVNRERVSARVSDAGATVFSGHLLLALVQKGVSREQAYSWVQQCALQSYEGKGTFADLAVTHPEIRRRLDAENVRSVVNLSHQLRNVDELFSRVLRSDTINANES